MTINESQGQSLKDIGVDLRLPCFGHGQLYVAFSRVTNVENLCTLQNTDQNFRTKNVVYPEMLLAQLAATQSEDEETAE